MYHKWQSYDVWFLRYGASDRQNFLSFWTDFCPFTPLTIRKIKILKKWKKRLEISGFNLMSRDSWFMMRFEISWPNSLLLWAFSWQNKKIKTNGTINGSVTFKAHESYLNTLNTKLCWLYCFFFCIDSFHIVHNQAN